MYVSQRVRQSTAIEYGSLDALTCPAVIAGANYWRILRGQRHFPARGDLRPRDIAGLLRTMSLIRFADGDYQYRIVGDSVVQAYAVPLQGRWFHEIDTDFPTFGSFTRPILGHVVEDKAPAYIHGRIGRDAPHVNFTDYELAVLPLGPDDETIDHIVVFSNYVLRTASGSVL